MLKLTGILFLLICLTARGQVINNMSPDRSNIYFHAADSAINIVTGTNKFKTITVLGDASIVQDFPSFINGIEVIKVRSDSKKIPDIKKMELRLVIKNIQIIRDQFKIPILTWGHDGRLGDGLYVFRYKYIPESMTYELREIKNGMDL